ncbi:MAG TPA: septal ring lytic transglycosylase RlpA family protein [Thermoanaerobaculia bacterium]|nr:septal ring lytic transglycosylase RlpA family protein [Thermoanaerobaculia bacterium]
MKYLTFCISAALALLPVMPARAQEVSAADSTPSAPEMSCEPYGPWIPHSETLVPQPAPYRNPLLDLSHSHRLVGTASYYSGFFEGRRTANGEVFRHGKFTGAHLTLPLGCWVDVRSKATRKVIRIRVNDRGPYSGGFVLDLSRSAARALGVDVAEDRGVEMRVVALPGEEPPAEVTRNWDGDEKVQVARSSASPGN